MSSGAGGDHADLRVRAWVEYAPSRCNGTAPHPSADGLVFNGWRVHPPAATSVGEGALATAAEDRTIRRAAFAFTM